jgi:NAD(P)-dependent dehydrogenase (short-subunit alcohol dehydrogenase family)
MATRNPISSSNIGQLLRGKTCLVTGASTGIGKATARELARLGARVIMVCRDRDRGERALLELQLALGTGNLYLLVADLSCQREVRRLAGDIRKNFDALHVLVNNAGLFCTTRQVTEDGIEKTLAVNHLAPFLLTRLLLDLLKAGAPARVINVGSAAYRQGRIRLEDLNLEKKYSSFTSYAQSKLALLLQTLELAERLDGSGVTVNCLHPGLAATEIFRDYAPFWRFAFRLFSASPGRAARTSVFLAADPGVEGITGRFFIGRRPAVLARHAQDAALRKELWEISVALTRRR